MDPNEALKRIREAVAALRAAEKRADEKKETAEAWTEAVAALGEGHLDNLLEHVEALDGWLSKGGFLPTDWAGAKR